MAIQEQQPLYRQISDDLREDIFSGKLAPGSMLPSENGLCSRYGVTRETVRKGLQVLAKEGLVFSRPKIGYFVSSPDCSSVAVDFSEEYRILSTRFNRASIAHADSRTAKLLGIPEESLVVELHRTVSREGSETQGYAIKYVPYRRGDPSLERAMIYAVDPESALSTIGSFSIYSAVEITAENADRILAEAMDCEPGQALLLVTRTYMDQNKNKVACELLYLKQPGGKLTGFIGIEPGV